MIKSKRKAQNNLRLVNYNKYKPNLKTTKLLYNNQLIRA